MSPKELNQLAQICANPAGMYADYVRNLAQGYLDLLKRHEAAMQVIEAARNTLNRQTDYQARWAMEEISDALKQLDKDAP